MPVLQLLPASGYQSMMKTDWLILHPGFLAIECILNSLSHPLKAIYMYTNKQATICYHNVLSWFILEETSLRMCFLLVLQ